MKAPRSRRSVYGLVYEAPKKKTRFSDKMTGYCCLDKAGHLVQINPEAGTRPDPLSILH